MKLKLAVFCLFIAVGIVDVHAAMPPNFERAEAVSACRLSDVQAANLEAAWSVLARRYFYASMEVMEDPKQFIRVRTEVGEALIKLRKSYGPLCVRPIG